MSTQPAVAPSNDVAPLPTSEPTPPQTRRIAPIPPPSTPKTKGADAEPAIERSEPPPPSRRQVLPGVIIGADDPDVPILPTRGPDGKFISPSAAKADYDADIDEAEGVEPPRPALPAPPPGTGKISFLGKEYNSIAEIEQVHRSLQGMHDPIARKLAQAEKDRDHGYMAGNLWHQEYEKVKAELDEVRSGRPASTNVTAPSSAPTKAGTPAAADGSLDLDSLVDGIDYDAFEMIAHDPQGGTRVAGKYLARQMLNTVVSQIVPSIKAEIMKSLMPTLQPLQMTQEETAAANAIGTIIEAVASYTDLEGKPAFPELNDPATLREIGITWRESGLPVEHAKTAQGLISAIGLYRMMKALPDGAAPRPPQPTVQPGPGASALAESDGGANPRMGALSNPREDSNLPADVRAIRRSLDDATPLYDRTLGFAVNHRRR